MIPTIKNVFVSLQDLILFLMNALFKRSMHYFCYFVILSNLLKYTHKIYNSLIKSALIVNVTTTLLLKSTVMKYIVMSLQHYS